MFRLILLTLLLQAVLFLRAGGTNDILAVSSANLHNVFTIEGRIFSGSAPESAEDFWELKSLGIKTIISVDGTPPPVELARTHGMRYIHIPVGYDGIKEPAALQILKAAEMSQEPLYIHCHHGKHRGPAAVAVICRGTSLWNEKQALGWLALAGTSSDYPGLFASAKFKRPPVEILNQVPTNFPEKVAASGMVEGMVALDKQWDHLKGALSSEQPWLGLESAMLGLEAMREMQRLPESKQLGEDFKSRMAAGEELFKRLHDFLKTGKASPERAAQLKQQISSSCSSCHKKYRN